MTRTVVLGIGNTLRQDDGAGVHAARLLAPQLAGREDVQILDAGTLSLALAPTIETADGLIVFDAAELAAPPGSHQLFLDCEFDAFLGTRRLSVHELGLRDVMDACRLLGRLPQQRALIGIQPESIEWGTDPTPAVSAGLRAMTIRALELLECWPAQTKPALAPPTHPAPSHTARHKVA